MISWLGREPVFPAPETALSNPDGLLAAGGDLSVPRLLAAYSNGIFPWYSDEDPILWWSPSRRMVMFPERLRVTRSLAKTLRNKSYEVTMDRSFRDVIEGCAAPRDGAGGTWIVPEMVEAYCGLFEAGHAHSVEVRMDGELVGGLYGVALGRMFFGESMFSRERDASKIAFVHMVRHLQRHGFAMIDCQMHTPHLESLGANPVLRAPFLATLREQIRYPQADAMWTYHYTNDPS
ncbi:leucyl/phenylalanyl-tRNA--protein transferase [Paludibacterium paludis]|uniref:Leucyl/phenylalanyl-tRNA--protein transferase n=1 Tax=Paludibacterium paludis TaxID=1225769 RepID=A0A918NYM8_9NEIS|nr:leucyl/phenylalanyl-tRNA--protein transferase [Paludibacterium paludis]GGY05874.1 leucyl/phenylalanyl-tRNA--protein transferase [Paludibacterium paludis]